jgi:molybdate transport system ATP-binding protein
MTQSSHNIEPFLSLENVTLRLYERILFENADWHFLSNQHWGVIGGNGAGKSTLMKALCGQVPVVSGRITYHFPSPGETPHAGTRPQDQIAYVAFGDQRTVLRQYTPYYQARWNSGVGDGRISVDEYLSELCVKRLNPYQVVDELPDHAAFAEHKDEVIDLLNIGDLLPKGVEQLSDGERRKVSIARALMQQPRLLILDNPLTGLDQHFRCKLTGIIQRLTEGPTQHTMRVIVVTTREDEIPPGITHVLVVQKGRIVAQGPREAILESGITHSIARRELPGVCRGSLPANPSAGNHAPLPQVLVQMKRVNVSYGDVRILQGVNWTVRLGEHWALLGRNGAGKTTLLSLILGDHPQVYANHISLFDKRRGQGESIWEVKRRIGWVAPELHLYHPRGVSGLHVVCSGFYDSVGLYHTCPPQQRQTARQWMQRLDIEGCADVPFDKLSEGEQRLVLLARALVKHPLLLILDEPCQGLDAGNRARIRQIVNTVGSQLDTSVIYVTHNPDELPEVITHALQLDGGKVATQGEIVRGRKQSIVCCPENRPQDGS